ncbi:trehalose-phosphatase [Rhizobium sp. BK376]|uniref:trehalose-phosphatase n=1 Tax=Rhizobium sp. BK376 TaxID=2512149 RepID=UPI00105320C5|nr:trehalose-phosphatase [Rhizobium sp. BK376]TCR90802.1 trehalose 6-phosphatase [Rhizobium sp. BK376]
MSYQEKLATGATSEAPMDEPAFTALSLNPEEWALFLDIDGTLIDLAETPDRVVVPPGLPANLHALSERLGGALALVTGRAVSLADSLFSPFRFPIAGLHGAERRDAEGQIRRIHISPAFEAIKAAIAEEAKAWPGVLIEDKGAAVGAHFRQAPEHQAVVDEMMQRHIRAAGPDWTLQRGKMVVEIRPARADKGAAVEAFLEETPFKGRRPLAIGDDVTDEAMFHAVNRIGGQSLRVGPLNAQTVARSSIPSPDALRHMIGRLVA